MKTQAGIVLRHLRGLAAPAAAGDVPDAQLLERFTARREEAAFTALVRRHGPMVLGVCRRVLRQEQDAEDAFQAAFLALARKAPSISKRDSVGSWLYQVAYHVAMKARERTANREKRERKTRERQPADPLAEISGRELLAAFDEELARLPERQRAPLVLCYLQGLTRDAAAQQLGCSESTLHRRLDEARARLRERLGRRGLALPAALLAAGTVAGAVPRALATSCARSAVGDLSAVPAAVAALAREALRGAPRRASKAVGALLLAVGLLAATAGLVGSSPPGAVGGNPPQGEVKPPDPPAPARRAGPAEKADFTVKGSVVDAEGKPVPGAKVAVIALVEQPYRGRIGERGHKILASGEADKEGRFRLHCVPATPSRRPTRQLLASAPGHGLGWLFLPGDADKSDLKIKLPDEQVIRGRLLDLQGNPAGGVKLHVAEVAPFGGRASTGSTSTGGTSGLGGGTTGTSAGGAPDATAPPRYGFPAQPARLDAWPAAAATDDDGRFVVRGIGKDQAATLLVTDERFARQRLVVSTAAKDKPEAVQRPLEPARWCLEGKVVGQDTGKPIGQKVLLDFNTRGDSFQVWADEKGNFRVNCPPSGLIAIDPYPPDGSPYLTRQTYVNWPKGKTKHEIKVELPRGVLVSGKVTEADSGKPVAGAVLTYLASQDNQFTSGEILSWHRFPGEFVRTKDDGTFAATVYPNKGILMAKGPTRDYVPERLDKMESALGSKFAVSLYAHAAVALDLKAGADAPPVALKLRRGVTVKGRVLDPDGKPVKSALLYHPLILQDQGDLAYTFDHRPAPVEVKDGTFTLTGLDPKAEAALYVLDRKNEIGGRVVVPGQSAGEDVTVKLQPCAKAKVRFVDGAGKPQAGHTLGLVLLLAPEPGAFLQQFDVLGGWGAVRGSDKDGQQTVPGLIPGATYGYAAGKKLLKFTAEAGKTHDLGDVPIPTFGGGSGGTP